MYIGGIVYAPLLVGTIVPSYRIEIMRTHNNAASFACASYGEIDVSHSFVCVRMHVVLICYLAS